MSFLASGDGTEATTPKEKSRARTRGKKSSLSLDVDDLEEDEITTSSNYMYHSEVSLKKKRKTAKGAGGLAAEMFGGIPWGSLLVVLVGFGGMIWKLHALEVSSFIRSLLRLGSGARVRVRVR